MELNRTHHLVCADDVMLLFENINIIKKNTEALLNDSKEVGVEVNTEKTECMPCLTTRLQYKEIKEQTKSGECLQPCISESSSFLSDTWEKKSVRIKIYRTVTVAVVLYGCLSD